MPIFFASVLSPTLFLELVFDYAGRQIVCGAVGQSLKVTSPVLTTPQTTQAPTPLAQMLIG